MYSETYWQNPGLHRGWAGVLLSYALIINCKADVNKLILGLELYLLKTMVYPCGLCDLANIIVSFNQGTTISYVSHVIQRIIDLIAWDTEYHRQWAKYVFPNYACDFYEKAWDTTNKMRNYDPAEPFIEKNCIIDL